jgi:O-phospho-L-seryl-tRNASec:L-selenocysteinyl-tRNA synthase
MFGSMLFTRCVSGTRAVARNQDKTIAGQKFVGFGSSHDDFPHAYLTAACAIGLTKPEMDEFFVRLDKCFKDVVSKRKKALKKAAATTASRLSNLELQT